MTWARTFRALLISVLLTPLCVYWARSQPIDRIFSLMVPPVALTMIVAVLNVGVRRATPRYALLGAELMVIYAELAVACAMASEWLDCYTPQSYGYATFAPTHPYYADHILPYLSSLLFFKDPAALKDFREGSKPLSVFLAQLPMWWPKIFGWSLFITLLCTTMLCINSLFREHWIYNEKLSFPIIQIPLSLADEGGPKSIWRSRVLWSALLAVFTIDMINGFSVLYPSIPRISVRVLADMNDWFVSPPWNQTGSTPLGIFPYVAALGFFMPTDLLFSLLFFFFFRKAQQIFAFSLGYEQGVFGGGGLFPSPPYFSEQSWGAFIGLFLSCVWLARSHWKKIGDAIFYRKTAGVRENGLSYRFVFIVLIGCLLGLGLFGVAIGLPFLWMLLYIGLFLMFSVAVTRLRAQLGAPTHEMAFMGPHQLILDVHGTTGLSQSLVTRTMSAFYMVNRIHRTHPQPTLLESQYVAERERISQRLMFGAILLAVVLGTVCGNLAHIYLAYRDTPASYPSDETGGFIRQIMETHRPTNLAAILAVLMGMAVVFGLDAIRFRYPGFLLHPAGYALAMNYGVDYYWFGLLIVLIVKTFVQKYFGLKGSARLRELAIGLIVGEYAAETIWALFSMLNHDQVTYSISINGKAGL
jgi:hypothetical protein